MGEPNKIKKLDETVVNRIAAGEIIQRPANALKELIENSLDAKSTNIQITVQDGGLKMMQIQDNGTGIRKEDLDIVCERFTTSKLQSFEDLQSISTFGFRGEALASISHVAHLTITTKTAQDKVAYKASYVDGKLKSAPKPIAGNQGTIILFENLFYNVATRKKAISNVSEEFGKIAEVVARYAIHNPSVGFTLKKKSETIPHIRTPHNSTKINNIKKLFTDEVARELIEINFKDPSLKFQMEALITNPNYSSKRMTFLLFINHRLVQSASIKKMLEDLYSIYLPKKSHPWCYMSLEINPATLDVNVHPTKHEVRFLHEDDIIEKVKSALDDQLSSNNASRTFYVQARLPQVNVSKETLAEILPEYEKETTAKKIYQKEMIRTDSKDQKLDQFNFTIQNTTKLDNDETGTSKTIAQSIEQESIVRDANEKESGDIGSENESLQINPHDIVTSTQNENFKTHQTDLFPPCVAELLDFDNESSSELPAEPSSISAVADRATKTVHKLFGTQENPAAINIPDVDTHTNAQTHESSSISEGSIKPSNDPELNDHKSSPTSEFKSYSVNNFRREVTLKTVLTLRKQIEDTYHEGLRKILSDMTFVGCIDEKLALIQSDVNLYICNTAKLAEELFYEIMLYDFANFGMFIFSEPLSIEKLALIGLDCEEAGWSEEDGPKATIAEAVKEHFLAKADLLKEYFSIVVDKQGNLKSLPILLEKYFPSESELPMFILRLTTEVDWTDEQLCFDGVCRETAKFFSYMNSGNKSYDWRHSTEHILYPAIKESLLPPKHFAHDSTILQIASLPQLYKVFERC